jgi:hypothetical protein
VRQIILALSRFLPSLGPWDGKCSFVQSNTPIPGVSFLRNTDSPQKMKSLWHILCKEYWQGNNMHCLRGTMNLLLGHGAGTGRNGTCGREQQSRWQHELPKNKRGTEWNMGAGWSKIFILKNLWTLKEIPHINRIVKRKWCENEIGRPCSTCTWWMYER